MALNFSLVVAATAALQDAAHRNLEFGLLDMLDVATPVFGTAWRHQDFQVYPITTHRKPKPYKPASTDPSSLARKSTGTSVRSSERV